MQRTTTYIHGTTRSEQDRLARLNELLNGPSLAALDLSDHESVLDVGAGLGILTRAIAAAVPRGRVVAVERDAMQSATASRLAASTDSRGIDWRDGDAHSLPLSPAEWGSFDVAFARFVVEHSPTPEVVVAEMARAVRPGGRVVLIDDDYALLRVHPPVAGLDRVWAAFCSAHEALGLDPWIGRRLPELLTGAGLEVHRCDWIFFGGCAGEARFDAIGRNFVELLAGARDHVLRGDVAPEQLDEVLGALDRWRHQRGAALWYGACVAEARRPCGSGFTLTP